MTKGTKEFVKKLISKGKIEKAINHLISQNNLDEDILNQVIHLSGEFHKLEEGILHDIISNEEKTIRRNKLSASLLKLVSIYNSQNIKKNYHSDDKDLTSIPFVNHKVIGREKEIELIKNKFNHEQVLLIHGIRGVGKSTIVKSFLNTYRENFNYAIWLDVLDDVRESIIGNYELLINIGFQNGIIPINSKISTQNIRDVKFDIVYTKLKQFRSDVQRSKKNILILDDIKDFHELKTTISKFPKTHWVILITSYQYFDYFKSNNILLNPLSENEAILLFKENVSKNINIDSENIIKLILQEIGNHTLTIELLGKMFSQSPDIDLAKLLFLLQRKNRNSKHFDLEIETEHNNYETPIKIFSYIEQVFDLNNLAANEQIILEIFALLPSISIKGTTLLFGFGGFPKILYKLNQFIHYLENIFSRNNNVYLDRVGLINSINSLVRKGWLVKSENEYKCHEIIREIVFEKLKKKEKNYFFIFYEHVIRRIRAMFHTEGKYMQSFLISYNLIELYNTKRNNLGVSKKLKNYYTYAIIDLGNTGLSPIALELINDGKTFFISRKNSEKDIWMVECLKIYILENNHKLYKETRIIIEELMKEYPLNRSNYNFYVKYHRFLGLYYERKNNTSQALIELKKGIKICEDMDQKGIPHIRCLAQLGNIYFLKKDHNKAKLHIEKSLLLSKTYFGHNNHPVDLLYSEKLVKIKKELKKEKKRKRKLKKSN